MDDFIKNLKDGIDALADVGLAPSTDFNLLPDWDSVAKLSLIALVASEYGVVLRADEVSAAASVAELWEAIQARRYKL